MDIKEIALKVLRNMPPIERRSIGSYCLEFAEALIAEIQKQNEPAGYLRTTEKALVFMPLTHIKDGEYFFTASQLLAAVAKKDEEIERLKHSLKLEQQLSDSLKMAARMPGTGNYVDWIKTIRNSHDQLATAEQRVAEACASLSWHCFAEVCKSKGLNPHHHGEWLKSAEAIRSGEWRKFVKEV